MLEKLFSNFLIIIYALLFGVTMKIADLLDEHGLKWFKGDAIIFGFLWGIFGSLLILSNNLVANIILAMNIAFIIRNRLDYINHQIAATIIIITFLFSQVFQPILFSIFFIIFLIFGSFKDYIDDILTRKQLEKKGLFYYLNELMLYYPIPTLIYCLLYGNWIVFWIFLTYNLSYNIIKIVYKKKGYL